MTVSQEITPGYLTGYQYGDPYVRSTSGFAVTANRLYAVPLFVYAAVRFTSILCRVNTLAGGTVARLGVYSSTSYGLPDRLVIDAGTVSTASTGARSATINWLAQPGAYWSVFVSDGTPTLAYVTGSSSTVRTGIASGGSLGRTCVYTTGSSSAFAATIREASFTNVTATNAFPYIGLVAA